MRSEMNMAMTLPMQTKTHFAPGDDGSWSYSVTASFCDAVMPRVKSY